MEVEEFHYDYAAVIERGDIDSWPEFFTEDADYKVIARDNADHDLPLGLIYCEGKAMLKDRAFALLNTEMYAPRYFQLRISTPVSCRSTADDYGRGELSAAANPGRGAEHDPTGRQIP